MKAAMIKRCIRALAEVEERDYSGLVGALIEEERGRGHSTLASELEQAAQQARAGKHSGSPVQARPLRGLRDSGGAAEAQLVRVEPRSARHLMILDDAVEERFQRIEREFAARHRLAKHGLKHTRRILMYGPPGCGKTLGGERLAWNTGLPLLKVHFDTLISSYFGESASNLRRVFEAAHHEPCILFLDECDYIARKRGDGRDVGEASRIVNTLLQLLEDYDAPGLLLAATNLDELLDHAIFRRFDDVFCLPLPGKREIARLLEVTLEAVQTDIHVYWDGLADELTGMSSATVVQVAQDAAKQVIMDGGDRVTHADIQRAIARIYRIRHLGGQKRAANT